MIVLRSPRLLKCFNDCTPQAPSLHNLTFPSPPFLRKAPLLPCSCDAIFFLPTIALSSLSCSSRHGASHAVDLERNSSASWRSSGSSEATSLRALKVHFVLDLGLLLARKIRLAMQDSEFSGHVSGNYPFLWFKWSWLNKRMCSLL